MEASIFPLDILSQQPRINRLYTHLTLCFAINDGDRTITTERLLYGCNILSRNVHWTAGEVFYQDARFQILCDGRVIPLMLEADDETTFEDLKASQFPLRMLHELTYAPCKTMATTDATKMSLPVFMVQANYVRGGLLLTFAGQHGAMDVTGLGQLVYLFSKACRDDSFTGFELDTVNMRRWDGSGEISAQIPPLGQGRTGYTPAASSNASSQSQSSRFTEHSYKEPSDGRPHTDKTDEDARGADVDEKPLHSDTQADGLVWTLFSFNKSNLDKLKHRASSELLYGAFVSTDDVLSAFIWISITRARSNSQKSTKSDPSTTSSTTLSRNVDMRPYLSIDPTYPGLLVQDTIHTAIPQEILHQSLGSISVQLRSALDPSSLRRAFNSQVDRLRTGGTPPPRNSRGPSDQEVRLSSWSKVTCYNIDLGFGRPICVRRPAFTDGAREGLVYFLPKGPDGSIAVMVCLESVTLDALREDKGFMDVVEEIG